MSDPGLFDRIMLAGLRATAEALFPENDLGAPDWKTTELTQRAVSYIEELPPPQRRLLWVLFFTVELLGPILTLAFGRFSKLRPIRRAQAVRRWRRSPFFLLRVLGDALKASTTMMYMSHPSVIVHIEATKSCDAVQRMAVSE